MKRIYVAGPYSADNVLDVLNNIRVGLEISTEIFLRGYAPFAPWLDFHFVLMSKGAKLTVPMFYAYSMAWLDVADAIFLCPGWQQSKGTIAECERAMEHAMPIFEDIDKMDAWFRQGECKP
jgi:hypothetical protein